MGRKPRPRLGKSDNLVTGKVGVVYKPAQNGSIYAAYATSARPPGSDFALSGTATNINNPNLDAAEGEDLAKSERSGTSSISVLR